MKAVPRLFTHNRIAFERLASPARGKEKFSLGDEIMNVPGEGTNAASLIVKMMRGMRQQLFAIVGSVEGQIVGAEEIITSGVDHVVAVAANRQFLPVEGILFAQRQR